MHAFLWEMKIPTMCGTNRHKKSKVDGQPWTFCFRDVRQVLELMAGATGLEPATFGVTGHLIPQ
jgi:hypothetical protein